MTRTQQSLPAAIAVASLLLSLLGGPALAEPVAAQRVASSQQLTHQQQQQLEQQTAIESTQPCSRTLVTKGQLRGQQRLSWQRRLAQTPEPSSWKPSSRDKDESKHGHISASHAVLVSLLCVTAMAALGFIGYKALQWYDRVKRPGYVELQSLDNAYHRPWAF